MNALLVLLLLGGAGVGAYFLLKPKEEAPPVTPPEEVPTVTPTITVTPKARVQPNYNLVFGKSLILGGALLSALKSQPTYIAAFQEGMNKMFKTGLSVDGLWGGKTLSAYTGVFLPAAKKLPVPKDSSRLAVGLKLIGFSIS